MSRGLPVVAGATLLVGGPMLLSLTAVLGVAAVVWGIRSAPARRAAAIDKDLPIVLEAVARQLRAGGSLQQAIALAAPGGRGALAASWARLVGNLRAAGVVGAVESWVADDTRQVRPAERLAAAALALAAETGGSPARAVDGVAATLRSRLAVAEELAALSSQARLSASVIAGMPLVFGALAGMTDGPTAAFFRTPVGCAVVAAGVLLDLGGMVWMRRCCRLGPS